jgi:hypothetical protein
MRNPRNQVDGVARIVLVIGAIVLLLANLIPRGAGRDFLIWLGAILIFVGIIGSIVGLIIGNRQPKGRKKQPSHWGNR